MKIGSDDNYILLEQQGSEQGVYNITCYYDWYDYKISARIETLYVFRSDQATAEWSSFRRLESKDFSLSISNNSEMRFIMDNHGNVRMTCKLRGRKNENDEYISHTVLIVGDLREQYLDEIGSLFELRVA